VTLPRRPVVPLALAAVVVTATAAPALASLFGRLQRSGGGSAATEGTTPEVFRRFSGQVVKLQVSETRSAAKAEVGSAFFVSADGRLITNYHVVAELVLDPDRYRAELVDEAGDSAAVTVLAIDVVHDLAVVRTRLRPGRWFQLGAGGRIAQGLRLYSLGHPLDEGIAIVEGTYNGNLPHTLYPRIRFTGALNPGMSGGPAITVDGRVVGVNVSTAGEESSYLVPASRAADLLARTSAPGFTPARDLLAEAGRQIREYQEVYLRNLFTDTTESVTLGRWRLPTQSAEFFDCWADASEEDDQQPYREVDHTCSTNDDIFISADQSSGVIDFEHELLSSDELDRFRFHAMYTKEFHGNWDLDDSGSDEVTDFACTTGRIRQRGLVFAAVFCVRRYLKLPGLYDAVLRLASIGDGHRGLLTTMTMSGVTFANAREMARRYIARIGPAR